MLTCAGNGIDTRVTLPVIIYYDVHYVYLVYAYLSHILHFFLSGVAIAVFVLCELDNGFISDRVWKACLFSTFCSQDVFSIWYPRGTDG